jgi:phosphopantothenoylcysteine decarboxylase/phosphopantothenate--cysteine ligase
LRKLQEKGFDMIPVMTRSATHFLGPLTLEKLSGHPVVTSLFEGTTATIEHISMARRSDLLLVAPATANILGKFAAGIADDFLSTLYLSTTTPTIVAPAMNVEMWRHPATQENLRTLRRRGVTVIDPEAGYQACGEFGEGRLVEPDEIVRVVEEILKQKHSLAGTRVLVTSGPTIEDIDPVRYLSNRSSGKMGFAVAGEAAARGAAVQLVSGPTHLPDPPGVEMIHVRSASEMAQAVYGLFPKADIVVKAAAVSDYSPVQPLDRKLKKGAERQALELQRTEDILHELGARKGGQFLVGFAAESENLVENASQKLQEKKLDLVVANDISRSDSGFESENNRAILIDRKGFKENLGLLSKKEVASRLWNKIEDLRQESSSGEPARQGHGSERETKP